MPSQTRVTAKSNPILAIWRLVRIVGITLYYLVRQAVAVYGHHKEEEDYQRMSNYYLQQWSRALLNSLQIAVTVTGTPPQNGALITPNHQSYLDILALSSTTPMVFLSKAEVDSWPFIGFLLRRAAQLTIQRKRRKLIGRLVHSIQLRLERKQSVCVFLEGTTTGGQSVSKFHPSLLQAAVEGDFPILPTAVNWSVSDPGLSVSEDVAYWKNHHFAAHIWRLLGLSGISAEVRFGNLYHPSGKTRHQLAEEIRKQVMLLHGSTDEMTS